MVLIKRVNTIISDYVDFRDVMKIAFDMYEDFKQAFLKADVGNRE